jgi:protein involved in polysaccharide export with SLBB domain
VRQTLRIAIAVAVTLCASRAARSQAPSGLGATRPRLEARAETLEQMAQATSQSVAARAEAAREAATIRQRLAEGDFKVGDRILLAVEGEPTLSDTFTVGLGGGITLPGVGDVSLAGVLRSELQPYLARRLAENLRDPVVRARAYVRLSILGAVARPGFYGVPAEALLSDALMTAGGPTAEADLRKLRIDRAGRPIWEGRALQQAIAQGRTIDEAGLVAGDQYVLPRRAGKSAADVLRFGGFLLSIPVTVYTLTRIF